jgi:hypothetical protein
MKKEKKISLMILIRMILVSFLISVFATIIHTYQKKNEIEKSLKKDFKLIENVFVPPLALAIWDLDTLRIKESLSSLLNFDYIDEITLIRKEYDPIIHTKIKPINFIEKKIKVTYVNDGKNVDIAEILIKIDSTYVYNQLLETITSVFLSNILQVAAIAFVIYFLINMMLIKNIIFASDFLSKIDQKNMDAEQLRLKRAKRNYTDEIDRMVDVINQMKSMIYHYTKNLEEIVAERTKSLNEKNQDMAAILDNLNQGIFTINNKLMIGNDYSTYLTTMFPYKDPSQKSLRELIFNHSNLSIDQIAQIESALLMSIGDSTISFECNSHVFPLEIEYTKDGDKKNFQTDWQAIPDESDIVRKVLISVKDVTEMNKLREGIRDHQIENEMIGQILNIGVPKFLEFMTKTFSYLDECQNFLFKELSYHDRIDIDLIFRNVHTIKGNARSYKLSKAVDTIHEVEEYLSAVKFQKEQFDVNKIKEKIEKIGSSIEKYRVVYKDKLAFANHNYEEKTTLTEKVFGILEGLYLKHDEVISEKLSEMIHLYKSYTYKDLFHILRDDIADLKDIALVLGKENPKVHIETNGVLFHIQHFHTIRDIFGHLFKNALAHGIETKEERIYKNKPPYGTIHISVEKIDDHFHKIIIFDDGLGLNLTRIAANGKIEGTNLSDEEIANLIFTSGLSTNENINDIAGRGIGLDAVKNFIKDNLKGHIHIDFRGPRVGNYRPFAFVISFSSKAST